MKASPSIGSKNCVSVSRSSRPVSLLLLFSISFNIIASSSICNVEAFAPMSRPMVWRNSAPIATTPPLRIVETRQFASNDVNDDDDGSYNPENSPMDMDGATEAELANTMAAESSKDCIDLPDEISNSYMQYALSIILGRALPDARDGLKPVHRRILYAMNGLSLGPGSSHRKCARVVGEVLGKYHPHGDVAVYDALVRMAQDFSSGTPLVDGHGNFGSVDNDPAAAMRYTECRLTKVSWDAMLDDLPYNTVDYIPNFDGNEREPVVLPAKLPFLLLNGSSGIAVGMSTNIPPHNLGELLDACTALLEAQDGLWAEGDEVTDKALFKFVPAPDFPTGATILGRSSSQTLYKTGHGGVVMRAKTHMEEIKVGKKKSDRTAIIVTELPYQVNKAALLEKVAALVNDKKFDGIADLRDESDRDGIRVVFELKRGAVPAVVLNNLFQKTSLQKSFSGNFLALMNSNNDGASSSLKPERFTLRSSLDCFLRFRFETLRRKTQHQLKKEASRAHILQGLLKALEQVEVVIATVRSAPDTASARESLMEMGDGKLELSKEQADAVLKLQLGQLTRLNKNKLTDELNTLGGSMEGLQELMDNDTAVRSLMREEFATAKQKYAVPRRSEILEDSESAQLQDIDLIENAQSVIVVTNGGYIKRMPLSSFDSQGRGTRGKRGTSTTGSNNSAPVDEEVQHCFTCNDHDSLLFMTNKGVAFGIRAFQVPLASRTAKGSPIPSVLPIRMEDGIASILPVTEFSPDEYIVLATEQGWIKKTPLDQFQKIRAGGLTIAKLNENDRLRWCKRCKDDDDILIGSRAGLASRFNASKLRPTKRISRGVKSMTLRNGDTLADLSILTSITTNGKGKSKGKDVVDDENDAETGKDTDSDTSEYVLAVTANGYGKRVKKSEFRVTQRGSVGVIATKFKQNKKNTDRISCLRVVQDDDEVLLVTDRGIIVRQTASAIPIQSRRTTGVLLQKVDVKGGDSIRSVSVVAPSLI
jgi:DNA gyrase subunit A